MNNNDKKFSYSKMLVFVTGFIFILVLAFVFYLYTSANIDSNIDVTVLVTCVTVTGTIFASNLCWYSKKAAGENNYKLRMSLYRDSSEVRLHYNECMMKLMKQYDMSEDDIDKINSDSDMDEMMDSALNDTVNNLDENRDDSSSLNEIQNM